MRDLADELLGRGVRVPFASESRISSRAPLVDLRHERQHLAAARTRPRRSSKSPSAESCRNPASSSAAPYPGRPRCTPCTACSSPECRAASRAARRTSTRCRRCRRPSRPGTPAATPAGRSRRSSGTRRRTRRPARAACALPAPRESGASGIPIHSPAPSPFPPTTGRSAWPRSVERSGASSSPTLISRTSSNPLVMTSMLEFTTASPSRPNFLTYCLCTASRNCSGVMPNSWSIGDTAKNAPRNALPCIRSWRSPRSVALRAILNPGSVNTRMFLSMICLRAQSGSRSHACSPSSSDSHTSEPPSDMPSSGLQWVNALGSQQRTTVTWRRSQLTRIRSGAAIMK